MLICLLEMQTYGEKRNNNLWSSTFNSWIIKLAYSFKKYFNKKLKINKQKLKNSIYLSNDDECKALNERKRRKKNKQKRMFSR